MTRVDEMEFNSHVTFHCDLCGWKQEHLMWNERGVMGGFSVRHVCPDKSHPMWHHHQGEVSGIGVS